MTGVDPGAVARAPVRSLLAVGYRSQTKGFDPCSGEGALQDGGCFNPPLSFPVIYLCTTRACVAAELARQASRQDTAAGNLRPREIWQIESDLTHVLDLTDNNTLKMIGVTTADLIRDDYRLTIQIGQAAHDNGLRAILTPSATGVDNVLAIFPDNLAGIALRTELIGEWTGRSFGFRGAP